MVENDSLLIALREVSIIVVLKQKQTKKAKYEKGIKIKQLKWVDAFQMRCII